MSEGAGIESSNIAREESAASAPLCKFFLTKRGCSHGSECQFTHSGPQLERARTEESTQSGRSGRGRRRGYKPPVCRQYLTPAGCRYGEKCRYRHVNREDRGGERGRIDDGVSHELEKMNLNERDDERKEEESRDTTLLDLTSFPGIGAKGTASTRPNQPPPPSHKPSSHRRHAPSDLSLGSFLTTPTTRPHLPVERPQRNNRKTTAEFREAEIEHLETRFHGNHRLVEKGKERSVYRLTFAPTDPDWNFKFNTIALEVTFPMAYPSLPLAISLPNDQELHPIYIDLGNQAISRYLATARSGSGELMFRPFLRWLDRTITTVFRDAAKLVTSELFSNSSGEVPITKKGDTPSSSEEDEEDEENVTSEEEEEEEEEEEGEMPATVSTDKRGTELRLSGLVMSDGVGVGRCACVRLSLQCTRCKAQEDHTIRTESPSSQLCSQCQHCYSFSYRPAIFHPTSAALGFLDLQGCQPVDLVLMQCELTLTCLECGRDNTTSGLNYGEHRELWCKKCHVKLAISVEQCRFVQHQPGLLPATGISEERKRGGKRKKKDPLIQIGKPLPEFGTCLHYKKSNRWLRFPCCGKPFPCDLCHDETEDHVMERANRMICGFCCREQTYSSSRPCIGCGGDLVGGRAGAFWEGGKGCRNKVKMSRNDIHKYTNSADKTKCKKQERVGKNATTSKH